jgi:hypothetical protein
LNKHSNGWQRSEQALAIAPWHRVVYVNSGAEADEWFGSVTHHRNILTVYPREMEVRLSLRIWSDRQLTHLIEVLKEAWREGAGSPDSSTVRPSTCSKR